MTQHDPVTERLLAYAAGELSGEEGAALAAGLSEADRETITRYRLVQAVLRADDSIAPPAAALARAKAIVGPQAEPERTLGLFDAVRRVVAKLTFDSGGGLTPALAGFRGGSDVRQLVFEADGTVVDLQLEPPVGPEPRWRIMGQVDLGPLEQGLVVGLAPVTDEAAAVAVTTDLHGGFHLSAMAGHYNIFVRVPDALVVLPNLVIG